MKLDAWGNIYKITDGCQDLKHRADELGCMSYREIPDLCDHILYSNTVPQLYNHLWYERQPHPIVTFLINTMSISSVAYRYFRSRRRERITTLDVDAVNRPGALGLVRRNNLGLY